MASMTGNPKYRDPRSGALARLAQVRSVCFAALLLSFQAIASADRPMAATQAADLVSRWPLPALGVNEPFVAESLTYLLDHRLLVADEDQESIWQVDPRTGTVQPWLVRPTFGMRPFQVRYDPSNRVVYVASRTGSEGVGQLQYLVLDEGGAYLDRWTLPVRDDMWQSNGSANRLSITRDGLLAWLINPPPGDPGEPRSQIATADRHGQRSFGTRCPEKYTALAAGSSGQFFLKTDLPNRQGFEPGYRIDRVDGSCRQQAAFYRYDGTHPYWSSRVGLASWPSPDHVYMTTDLGIDVFNHAGARQYRTYVPDLCPDCQILSVAPRPDNHFAVLSEDDLSGQGAVLAQAIQFDAQGGPMLRTIFRPARTPVDWMAGRLTVDHADRVHVLYPDSDRLVTFSPAGTLERQVPAPSWALDVDAGGGTLTIKGSSGAQGSVRLLDPDGRLLWHRTCDCDTAAGVAVGSGGVIVPNAAPPRLQSFELLTGTDSGAWSSPRVTGDALPLDVTTDGDRTLLLDGVQERIQAIDARGKVRSYVGVPAGTFRIDVGPGGRLGALTRSGGVHVHGVAGWQEVDLTTIAGAESLQPRDLAWTPAGTLTILDADGPSILQLKVDVPPAADPTPPPDVAIGGGSCRVTGDKQASPRRVFLGEPVEVRLTLDIACPASPRPPLDILILLGSGLTGGNGTEPHDYQSAAWQVAERVVEGLDLSRDRVAIYLHGYGQLTGFSGEKRRLHDAIVRSGRYFNPYLPADANSFDGLGWAFDVMDAGGRRGATRLLVQIDKSLMITQRDGTDIAAESRRRDVRVILVFRPLDGGLPSAERQRLRSMVAAEGDVLNLDDVLSSDALLERILQSSRAGVVRDVEVWDEAGPDMTLLRGSPAPRAWEGPSSVRWHVDGLPTGGMTLTLSVQTQRLGTLPTNRRALADFTDPAGVRRRFEFPVPVVEVIAPPTATRTAPPIATATPSFTPPPTPTPAPVYLPLLLREMCTPEQRRVDVVLVLDASLSMLESADLGSAQTKLDAAREAARSFLDALRLDQGDQAAIVAFNAQAALFTGLTADRFALDSALASLTSAPQTCIVCGMATGASELASTRSRVANAPVLILLTDGRSNPQPVTEAVARAAEAKAAGIRIYTIGLGADLDEAALREMASGPSLYFQAPTAQELAGIYREIAVDIPCPAGAFWGGR